MAFPTLASLDAALVPALADSTETGATYRSADGVEVTGLTVLFDEVELEGYSEDGGTPVVIRRREAEFLRSQVTPVGGGLLIRADGTRWRVHEQLRRDAARTRWIVTPLLAEGA